MNKDRLTSLAIHMRHHVEPENFDMATWFKYLPSFFAHSRPISKQITMCGTTACIAGHAVALFEPDRICRKIWPSGILKTAEQILDLTPKQSVDLFLRTSFTGTPAQAANVIQHLANTGEVDWTKADKFVGAE